MSLCVSTLLRKQVQCISLLQSRYIRITSTNTHRFRQRDAPNLRTQNAENEVTQLEDIVSMSSLTSKQIKHHAVEDVERQRKKVLFAILKKKSTKHEQETNMLTWEAKEQIRYLNNEDPECWTPQVLSESFPISEDGVIRLLKSNYKMGSIDDIVQHDTIVAERWKELTGKAGPHSKYAHLWQHASGNKSLPESDKKLLLQSIYPWKNPHKTPGIFESIIVNYRKNAEKANERQLGVTENDYKKFRLETGALLQSITKRNAKRDARVQRAHEKEKEQNNSNDHSESTARQKRWLPGNGNTKSVYSSLSYDDPVLSAPTESRGTSYQVSADSGDVIEDGMIANSHTDIHEHVPKVELLDSNAWRENSPGGDVMKQRGIVDSIQYNNDSQAYMYDSQKGYQYPLGHSDEDLENLPKHKLPKDPKPNSALKSGDSFYDDDGEFLYRIP